jgi:hypothetical protein
MNKNTLDNLFKNLKNDFDIEMPNNGHEKRFLNKLNNQNTKSKVAKTNLWKPSLGIAASIILMISLFTLTQADDNTGDLASVSPKMAETQDFFTLTINEELTKLNEASTPEVQNIIDDALLQIKKLENDYTILKSDLIESGDDNRVIYAMISNFQNRIDILQHTLHQIKNIKQLKNSSHNETSNSII